MAASLGLSHEAYSYSSSPFLADCAPSFPAAVADFAGFVDGPFEYSPPPPPPPAFGCVDENDESMICGNEAKKMSVNGRIGFRTKSEVEILDDGFKWRKYGKKAVKNSPNPRNYYRCSAVGCGVKKRVERDRDDPRYVVTTYEGVHNHVSPGTVVYTNYYSPPRSASPAYSGSPWANAWRVQTAPSSESC